MTKSELVDAVADAAHLSKRQTSEILEIILHEIKTALGNGDRVALTPFGNFVVRARGARAGRNPKTGDAIDIAARNVPAFVAGKSLKDAVAGKPASRRATKARETPTHGAKKKKNHGD